MATKRILVGDYDGDGNGYHEEWQAGDTLVDPNGVPIGGVTTFLGLSDTPSTYVGQDGKFLTVDGVSGEVVFTTLSITPTTLESYDATGDISPGNNTYVIPLPNPVYVLGSLHAFVNGRKLLKTQVVEYPDQRTVDILDKLGAPLYLDNDPVLGETLEFLYAAN